MVQLGSTLPPLGLPVIGLGTWQAQDDEIEVALTAAIEAGYRHIDTAYHYRNEAAIGRALKKLFESGKVSREEIFITTKLPLIGNRAEYVETFLKLSLEALQLTYVDLYLIHYPVGLKNCGVDVHFPKDENGLLLLDYETDHIELWKAMESQVDAGRAKNIGLSNFNIKQIQRILNIGRIPVSNVQVELHIYHQNEELLSFCKKNDISVCAYSPLGSPNMLEGLKKEGNIEGIPTIGALSDPVIKEIAEEHGKTPAQLLLRFLLELGVAVIPKSSNPNRIKENIQVFDFELTKEEFNRIKSLDRSHLGRVYRSLGFFSSLVNHPEYPLDVHWMNKDDSSNISTSE